MIGVDTLPGLASRPPESAVAAGLDRGNTTQHRNAGGAAAAADAPSFDNIDEFLAAVERRAYRIGYYALGDEQAALDVVQDSMLKLVEKYSDRPQGEWPALFFTILHHRITDVHRWKRLREAGGRLVSLFWTSPDNGNERDLLNSGVGVQASPERHQPDRQAMNSQLGQRIDAAVNRLSRRQRQVFLLREWQGFSVRDTAKILGCSEGSVKQHHYRAIQALRIELTEVWNND